MAINISSELEEHLKNVTAMSFELEGCLASIGIFLPSQFIDNIASMIIYEQNKQK